MLLEPRPHIVGDADIQRSVPAAGEDVDIVSDSAAHGSPNPRLLWLWVPTFAGTTSGLRQIDLHRGTTLDSSDFISLSEQIKNTLASI